MTRNKRKTLRTLIALVLVIFVFAKLVLAIESTTRISTDSSGNQSNNASYGPVAFSANG